jgi:hypothetical protein
MWSTSAGGHLMKVVNLTGFTVYSCSGTNIKHEILRSKVYAQLGSFPLSNLLLYYIIMIYCYVSMAICKPYTNWTHTSIFTLIHVYFQTHGYPLGLSYENTGNKHNLPGIASLTLHDWHFASQETLQIFHYLIALKITLWVQNCKRVTKEPSYIQCVSK